MSDRRRHRGRHPDDDHLFASAGHAALCEATSHLGWLLSRGYADRSALKLVGDRFSLTARQRIAVRRCACSDDERWARRRREVEPAAVSGRDIVIDGYNVLTTIEAALAGGVLLLGRDGCLRDMASMHGSYRRVEETDPALRRLGTFLVGLGATSCRWLLDQPVSNSGRLAAEMRTLAAECGWAWAVELVPDPDAALCSSDEIVATADRAVLDDCGSWFNLAYRVAADCGLLRDVVDLSG